MEFFPFSAALYKIGVYTINLVPSQKELSWWSYPSNTELNDLRKTICLRKSEVSDERISFCNVIENWRRMAYTVDHAPIPLTSLPVTVSTVMSY